MARSSSGKKVLRFAVSGALLGGGMAAGGCMGESPKTGDMHVNPGPEKSDASKDPKGEHVNVAKEPEPKPEPDRVNIAKEPEPEPDRVNIAKEPEPDAKPNVAPDISVNPGPETDPVPKPEHPKRVNTAREPEPKPPADEPAK